MKSGNTSFPVLLKPWIDDGLVTITESEVRFVKTGSLITLKQMRTEEDAEKARGNEKHVAVLDEATQIQARHIANIRAWVRMPKEMKEKLPQQIGHLYPGLSPQQQMDLFPKVIHTANPEGASVGYYRRQFIMPAKPFEIWRAPEKDGGFLRQYIPSRIDDNPSADKEAQRTRLMGLGEARANALIGGVWDAPTGDFFKEYNDEVHTCHNFLPPSEWFTFRTFDWGTNEPFAVLWWCVSDGQEFNFNGRTMWFPRGALIAYREWYGCDKEDPAKGSGIRNQEIAAGIISRSAPGEGTLTITDSLPFQDRGMGSNTAKYTIADIFAECGCPLVRGNTARVHGWSQLRDRLIGMPDGSGGRIPMIYFTESCAYTREYIPAIPYHPTKTDDAAESGEPTHLCLHGSTLVRTPNGVFKINEMPPEGSVIAGDGLPRMYHSLRLIKANAETVKLYFDDGTFLICTPDHKILTRKGWLSAIDCEGVACLTEIPSREVFPNPYKTTIIGEGILHAGQKTCTRIEKHEPANVYCLTEPVTNSFTLANGVIVANCDCVRLACTSRPLVVDQPRAIPQNKNSDMLSVSPIIKMITQSSRSSRPHLR